MYGIDWSIRGSDVISYIIGCAAIAITLWVVVKQERLSKKIDKLRHETREYSLEKIKEELEHLATIMSTYQNPIKSKYLTDDDKINIIKEHFEFQKKYPLEYQIDKIRRELEYLKGSIDPVLYDRIEDVLFILRGHEYDILKRESPKKNQFIDEFTASLDLIVGRSKGIMETIDELLVQGKKSPFLAKGYPIEGISNRYSEL